MTIQRTDDELIKKAQHGSRMAFDCLVLKYQNRIAKLVSRYIISPNETLDLTQETFLRAYNALPQFNHKSCFYTWLYRIAVNTTINQNLAERSGVNQYTIQIEDAELRYSESKSLNEINSPEELLQGAELGETLLICVEKLPNNLKEALVLREIQGLSYNDIAEQMHCPVGTVRSRLARAREIVDGQLQVAMSGEQH